ncbi:MAG: dephospho-CoA kinase [Betaproteobacteria bacterium]|nr:dephospho-CoA kinase [Betaproteobacteria bacterium]NBY71995.1 dephospho-CoA kinase [Betaproteobacteria bacterium]
MFKLGLTGGIGSGKSTVAALLVELGATLIDADAISRALTASGGAALPAIAKAFGPSLIHSSGALDRDLMRAKVFADPAAKLQLEAIIHPLVRQELLRQMQAAQRAGATCVVCEIPLLVESGHWKPLMDQVLVVDCSPQTQIQRTMARSGMTAEQVQSIIQNQATRAQRLAAADVVVLNDGVTLDELRAEVARLAPSFGL